MGERIYIFKGFERFWHWTQAVLIITLLTTGFEIHGTYKLFGFAKALSYHTTAAWSLIGLWVFAIFWHVTTGEWRHYIPTTDKVLVVPQLVAYDPMFQERIIGRAVRESEDPARVHYSADAILPDPEVGHWIVRICEQLLG